MNRRKRLTTLFVSAAILICAVLFYIHFWLGRPVGSGPAGPPASREPFIKPWTTQTVLLVGLGDSITAGFGARRGYSYFDRLISNPPDESPDMKGICLASVLPNLRTTNLAVSGSTSMEHVGRQLPRLPAADSNILGIVVITTGGNDLIHDYGRTAPREQAMYGARWDEAKPWIERFEQRLEAMVAQINSRFPGGCHVFLANIYDPTDGVGDMERAGLPAWEDGLRILHGYNDIIRRCVERHKNVHLVNLHDAFLGHGIHCTQFWSRHYDSRDPHYWYHENIEDPNERGYDVIRRLFLIEMAKAANQLN